MRISNVVANDDYTLRIESEDGQTGLFDVKPYLEFEAFSELKRLEAFKNVVNGRYFVEWECGADLSADSIEASLHGMEQPVAG